MAEAAPLVPLTGGEIDAIATLFRSHRLLFIEGHAVASTAVYAALRRHLGGEPIPPQRVLDDDDDVVVSQHSTLPSLIRLGLITPDERSRLLVFTTVRNPFDFLVSTYAKHRAIYERGAEWWQQHWGALDLPSRSDPDGRARSMLETRRWVQAAGTLSFTAWVVRKHRRRGLLGRVGATRRGDYPQVAGVDRIIKYERLQEDLHEILREVGYMAPVELPRINVTPGRERDYRSYYDDRSRRLVERAWKPVLDRFGYRF